MHISLRRLLFAFFALVFVVSAPLVVLYTAGYRLNISNRRLQQTGVLAVTTYPRGSTVVLNGVGLSSKSSAVIQRITPNTHTLTLQKKGYHPWTQRVVVEEGKTTYVTTRLFAESKPKALSPTETTLALRLRPQELQTTDKATIVLVDNGSQVEVRAGTGNDAPLVGLLPQATYTPLVEGNDYVLLRDERNTAFVIAREGGAVVKLPTALTAFDWLEAKDALLWTDGTEVNMYEASTGERTFITRDGQAVTEVVWHPEADSFFVVSGTTLSAYDRSVHETRVVTPLLTNTPIAEAWIDSAGKNLYFTETKLPAANEAAGNVTIFALPLVL